MLLHIYIDKEGNGISFDKDKDTDKDKRVNELTSQENSGEGIFNELTS